MRVIFIGVGEAFDERLPNASLLVASGASGETRSALLDCGFSAPFSYWRLAPRPLELDLLWVSHFHGDHFFGVPALLLRFHEEGRRKPLVVVGQDGVEDIVLQAMDLAYPGARLKFPFALTLRVARPGESLEACGFSLSFDFSDHPRPNLGLRLSDGRRALFYSGDGRPTAATRRLARKADLAAQESYSLEPDTEGHGTVAGAIAMAREVEAKRLALLHLRRDVRHARRDEVLDHLRAARDLDVRLPEPGDTLDL